MKKLPAVFGLAAAIGLTSTASFAAPLGQLSRLQAPGNVVEAHVVCDETGVCVRPPSRRPTAHWIYGDRSFYGPYDGPRYYGNPSRRYGWWIFGLW
jgi:hypothetical protein